MSSHQLYIHNSSEPRERTHSHIHENTFAFVVYHAGHGVLIFMFWRGVKTACKIKKAMFSHRICRHVLYISSLATSICATRVCHWYYFIHCFRSVRHTRNDLYTQYNTLLLSQPYIPYTWLNQGCFIIVWCDLVWCCGNIKAMQNAATKT